LANCTKFNIHDLSFSNTTVGLTLGFSIKNIIKNNSFVNTNRYGIFLQFADNNSLNNNTVNKDQFSDNEKTGIISIEGTLDENIQNIIKKCLSIEPTS